MTAFSYQSNLAFLKAPPADRQPYAIAGICWDGATTQRPGARMGPRAIREASHMLCDGTHPLFDTTPLGHLGDAGDLPLPNTSLEAMREAMAPLLPGLIERHHMVWLGGDHSITLPLLRAYCRHFGRPLAVIHFDAHCDTWTDHFGEPSGHGTWVHEAFRDGLVHPGCFTQIGIRSPAERAAREYVRERGGVVHTARDLRGVHRQSELQGLVDGIATRWRAAGEPPLYLSLDIDCLDPASAPGTGTPEPGGLGSAQVLGLVEALSALPFVGMDCVEVAPPYDHADLTSHAAATLVWTYLCGRIAATAAAPAAPSSRN